MSFSESSPFLAAEHSPERLRQDIEKGKQFYEYFKNKEVFGERFIGFDHLEERFTLPDGTKCLEVNEELKNHAYQSLAQKFNEPDIGVWWDSILCGLLPKDEIKRKKWILFYHPKAEMRTSLENPALRGPVSIRSLMSVMDTGLVAQGKTTRFVRYLWGELENESSLNDALTEGWELVTEEMAPDTRSKTLDGQNAVIHNLSEAEYFERLQRKSRKPIDIVFDCALAQASGVPHLTGWNYERTQQQTDAESVGGRLPGRFMVVGSSKADGVIVLAPLPSNVDSCIGSCPSR